MINVISSSRYKIHRKEIHSFATNVVSTVGIPVDKVVNIVFVGKRRMLEVTKTYKHEDEALPVLAFPYKNDADLNSQLFGEVVLCYPQVVLLAAERGKKLDDMIHQLVEHGIRNLLK